MVSRAMSGRVAGIALAAACALGPGCDAPSESTAEPAVTCSDIGGTWAVVLDYGSGSTWHQDWTIAQAGCLVTMTGAPPDPHGAGLGATPRAGDVRDGILRASWDVTTGPCPYHFNLEATFAGDAFSGSVFWIESACNGWPGNAGSVAVTGTR